MRERRRDYELLFIISPLRTSEEDIRNAIDRVTQTITNLGGLISATNHTAPWGRRRFAYPIRAYAEGEASRRVFTEGYYVLLHFQLAANQVAELERLLKLNDSVLRYLLTLVEAGSATSAPVLASGSADEDEDEEDAGDDEE